jgi:hypothetical protein
VDVFTLVTGGLVAFFVLGALALGLFSKRSALDILDWKPTRSPEVEAAMMAAQNEIRRRRGKPERTLEDVEAEWHGS